MRQFDKEIILSWDPDYRKSEQEEVLKKTANQLSNKNSPNSEQIDNLIKLFREKINKDKERQTNFLNELDQQLTKQGIEGITDASNFKTRLILLSTFI